MTASGAVKGSWKHKAENSLSIDTKYFTFSTELDKQTLAQIDRCPKKIIGNRSWAV
jgi:hypothetical protein